jgi:hypothetical protein
MEQGQALMWQAAVHASSGTHLCRLRCSCTLSPLAFHVTTFYLFRALQVEKKLKANQIVF